jgi:exopolyphosphatase/pppGpp-phosphohydrolase
MGAAGLSGSIQQQGLEVLGELKTIAMGLGAVEMRAVATEVFRKAANGAQFLESVESRLGIQSSIIAQEEEARLGWLTAVAGSVAVPESVLAWDSGGGSFQITARRADIDEMQSFLGEWGSTVATDALVSSIRGGTFTIGGDVNPVSMAEARALVAAVRQTLPPPPAWLTTMLADPATRIVGIGGDTCLFRRAAEVSGMLPGVKCQSTCMYNRIVTRECAHIFEL